jgi:hypothetical protein
VNNIVLAFQPGKQYKYFYIGQALNGVPQASKQHSGTQIQAVVILQMESQDTMLLKLKHIRIGSLNRKIVNPRLRVPFRTFHPVPVLPEFVRDLEMPIKFQYTNGLITNIIHERHDSSISVNVKRGVLNLLQVNTLERGSVDTDHLRLTNDFAPQLGRSKVYKVMEKSVEGECETLYSVAKLPTEPNWVLPSVESSEESTTNSDGIPRLNVTKTINFEHCNHRPTVRYNYRNSEFCNSCDPKFQESAKYLKSSSVLKYNLLGNRRNFVVQKATAESQHSVEFYSETSSFITVYINQTLTLVKTAPIGTPIQQQDPASASSELLYSRQWDLLNEKFQMDSDQGYSTLLRNKEPNFVEEVLELLKKLSQVIRRTKEPLSVVAANRYQLLVTALRKATPEELQQIHRVIYVNPTQLNLDRKERKVTQDILTPAIASAGTEAAVRHITELIKENQVKRPIAVSALRQLMNARVVSIKSVNRLKHLCQSNVVKSHRNLKQSCFLALGSLVKAACSSQQDKLAVDEIPRAPVRCTLADKKSIIKFLINKIRATNKWQSKVLYLKSLANAALPLSVLELEKIIQNHGQFNPEYVRYEAIVALRQITQQVPQKIQRILMPIFMNTLEPSSLRQVAAYFVLQTLPPRPILDMLAKQVDREPIRQVAMTTYQTMEQLANSTNPCLERLAADLKLSLRLARQHRPSLVDSKVFTASLNSIASKVGIDLTAWEMLANNSIIPKTIGATISTNTFGFFNKDLFTAAVNTEGLEGILMKIVQSESFSDYPNRHPRSVQSPQQSLKKILEKLQIKSRLQRQQPMVYGYWRYQQQEVGYSSLTESDIHSLLSTEPLSYAPLEQLLRTGVPQRVNWNHAVMLQDAVAKVPTLLGLPIILKHKTPVVMRVEGTLKGEVTNGYNGAKIEAQLTPSVVVKTEHTAEVWSPSAPSGARVRAQIQAQLPLSGEVSVDRQTMKTKITMNTPTQPRELLKLKTQPVTFIRNSNSQQSVNKEALERVVQSEDINRVQKIRQSWNPAGIPLQLNARYVPVTSSMVPTGGNWMPICPLSGPNKVSIVALPPNDNTEQVEVTISPTGAVLSNEPLVSKLISQIDPESSSESLSSEEPEYTKFSSKQKKFWQIIAEVKTKGSSIPRHYRLNLKTAGNPQGLAGQLELKMSRISPQPYQICLQSEILYPAAPFTRAQLQKKKVVEHTEIRWGETCRSNNYVQLTITGERTRKQQQWERQNLEEYHECTSQERESPIACYDYLRLGSRLNKYTFNLKYNNVSFNK